MSRRRTYMGLGLGLLCGCAGIFGFEELADAPVGADAGPLAEAGPAVADLYVSPTGSDDADGSRATPLRSIGAASARALTLLARGSVVRVAVCAGTYPEKPFAVAGGTEIRGNYDCASWTRREPDVTNPGVSAISASVVTDVVPNVGLVELTSDGTGAPLLDGLHFATMLSNTTIGSGGNATLRQVSVANETPPNDAFGRATAGISLAGAGTTIEQCNVSIRVPPPVEGAAVGILSTGGTHVIRRNVLRVAEAKGGCVGITIGQGSGEITENQIELFACVGLSPKVVSAAGVIALDSPIRSTRNSVYIEAPGNTQGVTTAYGFSVLGTGAFTSDGDRVRGPTTLAIGNTIQELTFVGFSVNGRAQSIVNASVLVRGLPSFQLAQSAGILFTDPSNAYVAHNSMFIAGTPKEEFSLNAITLSNTAIDGGVPGMPGPSAVVLESNLLVSGTPGARAVRGSCSSPNFARITGTRYGGAAIPTTGGSCTDGGVENLAAPGNASNNMQLACPNGCAELFDLEWETVRARGLVLTPAGCAADLSVPYTDSVPTDGTGAVRKDGGTRAGSFDGCE